MKSIRLSPFPGQHPQESWGHCLPKDLSHNPHPIVLPLCLIHRLAPFWGSARWMVRVTIPYIIPSGSYGFHLPYHKGTDITELSACMLGGLSTCSSDCVTACVYTRGLCLSFLPIHASLQGYRENCLAHRLCFWRLPCAESGSVPQSSRPLVPTSVRVWCDVYR